MTLCKKTRAAQDGPAGIKRTWQRYFRHRRLDDRNTLVVHYAHVADSHAARLARRLPQQVTFDEIRCAAFDGLLQAVQAFDPRRSARFETFCHPRVAGAVMDWLRTLDPQSRAVRTFERKRARTAELLDRDKGYSPTPKEIAARMDMPLRRFKKLTRISQAGRQIHFSAMEAQARTNNGGATRAWDVHDPLATDPSRRIARQMLADYISRGLTRDERMTLILYYYEQLTMAEIGVALDLSESRVSQIHKDILTRLRARFGPLLAEELVG